MTTTSWISEEWCLRVLGSEAANKAFEHFTGRTLYIPRRPRRGHMLAEALGLIGMAILCREYGSSWVTFANGHSRRSRKSEIMKLTRQGLSSAKISALTGVTTRYITMVRREYRTATQDPARTGEAEKTPPLSRSLPHEATRQQQKGEMHP